MLIIRKKKKKILARSTNWRNLKLKLRVVYGGWVTQIFEVKNERHVSHSLGGSCLRLLGSTN